MARRSTTSELEQEFERVYRILDGGTTRAEALVAIYAGLMAVRQSRGTLAAGYGPDRPITLHPIPLWLVTAACDLLEDAAAGKPRSAGGRHANPIRRLRDQAQDQARHLFVTLRLDAGDSKKAAFRAAARQFNTTTRVIEQTYGRVQAHPERYARRGLESYLLGRVE